MDYKEQLKHPKWQKKRLEIMQRDNFQCQCCFSKEDTLTVHHKKYIDGKSAWEYPDNLLITLCEDCHQSVHLHEKSNIANLLIFIKDSLSFTDVWLLQKRIGNIILEQGLERGLNTINKLLLSQTIKKDQI